jgi:hypothetical protein
MRLAVPTYHHLDPKEDRWERFVEFLMAPVPSSTPLPWSRNEKVFVLVALALFAVLCIGSIRNESITANEVAHIPAGLSYLQRFDARMNIEHPPLIKAIAAMPLLLLHAKADYGDPTWSARPGQQAEYLFGKKFFESWNANQGTLLFLARLPMVALTLLLAVSLYEMARRLAGPWGGALTLTVFVTSPFFIAHGSLVLTDISVALFSLWTMWYFASLWQEPAVRNGLLFAASLAAALLTKFSAVFLFPTLLLCWAWFRFSRLRPAVGASAGRERFARERLAIGAILLAGLVVYLFYQGIFHRSDPISILQDEVSSLNSFGGPVFPGMYRYISFLTGHPVLERILLPLSLYVGGLSFIVGYGSRPMYFLGHWQPHGVWFYFPVMSFFKLAPGMVLLLLLLAALATANFLRKRGKGFSVVPDSNRLHLRAMLATLVVFAAIAMASHLNVGVRHFSVPITVAVLLCSLVIPLARSVLGSKAQPFAFGATLAMALSCAVTALLAYPHYVSYYNVFRLNVPKQEIAINSNLGWGQSMKELDAFFKERRVRAPYVDTRMSGLDPAVYIPGARAWLCDTPDPVAPEWVAVSADRLLHEPPNCEQLLRYPSWTIGDGTIMVFRITEPKLFPDLKPRGKSSTGIR